MSAATPESPIRVHFLDEEHLKSEFSSNLKTGGIFVPNIFGYAERQSLDICLVHPSNGATLVLRASVVWVHPSGRGVGVAMNDFDAPLRERIGAFIADNGKTAQTNASEEPEWVLEVVPSNAPEPVAAVATEPETEPEWQLEVVMSDAPGPAAEVALEPESESADSQEQDAPHIQNLNERLRRLNPSEQVKVARGGTANERIALERIYGKAVWDALLQNSALTQPEVARIARMGSLPMSLVETIVNNPAWLSSPQVRRAVLTNPRLRRDLITKVLNSMPQSELRLVPKQTSYPSAIREEAKKLLARA